MKKQPSMRFEENLLKEVKRLAKKAKRSEANLVEFLLEKVMPVYDEELDRMGEALKKSVKTN